MPYLKIQTNKTIDDDAKRQTITKASSLVASELGKPERYVMIAFEPMQPMVFAGNSDACAYLELKSIGLPEDKTAGLSAALCKLMEEELNIQADRVYIEFADARRAMWGWNGGTF